MDGRGYALGYQNGRQALMARVTPLPVAAEEYDTDDEQNLRSILEHEIQDIRNEMDRIESIATKEATLALRRHQFLFIGYSS